jgi:hypothetical protein
LKKDEVAYESYKKAVDALKAGTIEPYIEDPEPTPHLPKQVLDVPDAYAVSFLIWAEGEGIKLPEYVIEDLGASVQTYHYQKSYRDQEKYDFPSLERKGFDHIAKEPLWSLAKAILYMIGHTSIKADAEILKFIQTKKIARKIIEYAKDANAAGALNFVVEKDDLEKPDWPAFAKVRPGEFIAWVKVLPLYLPILQNNKTEKGLHTKERETLLKMIIGMAVDAYGYDPQASRSSIPGEIAGHLAGRGISIDEDTVRKWLKEAASVLPRDQNL